MKRPRVKALAFILWIGGFVLPAQVAWAMDAVEDLEKIKQAAETYLHELYKNASYPVKVRIDALDPRLRLASCGQSLDVETKDATRRQGRLFLSIKCAGPKPWRIFVPVTLESNIDVVKTRRVIVRGKIIEPDDLQLVKMSLSQLPASYYNDLRGVVGQQARRLIDVDRVVTNMYLKPPYLIKQGQRVTVIASSNGIKVQSAGVALKSAEKGQIVSVRNTASGRIIEGTAIHPGVVEVKP